MNFEDRYQEINKNGYDFTMSEVFGTGWNIFYNNIGSMVLLTLVMAIGTILLSTIPLLGSFLGMLYSTILMAGIYIVAFKIIRGEQFFFGDYFLAAKYILTLILASLLSGLFTLLGWMLIIPGLYLLIAYFLINPLIIDKDMDFWSSMEYSRKIVTKKWFLFCWFVILLCFVNLLGGVLAGIGLLITIPYSTCVVAVCYDKIIGVEGKESIGIS